MKWRRKKNCKLKSLCLLFKMTLKWRCFMLHLFISRKTKKRKIKKYCHTNGLKSVDNVSVTIEWQYLHDVLNTIIEANIDDSDKWKLIGLITSDWVIKNWYWLSISKVWLDSISKHCLVKIWKFSTLKSN